MADSVHRNDSQTAARRELRTWRLRWSLRVLIAATSLFCLGFAWVSHLRHVGLIHRDVEAKIQAMIPEREPFPRPQSEVLGRITANRLSSIPGTEEVFQRLQHIHLTFDLRPDDFQTAVEQVERLDRLPYLGLTTCFANSELGKYYPRVSDTQLAQILSRVQIDQLDAPWADLKSGTIPSLRQTRLKRLNLSYTSFSDTGIDDLPDSLEYFNAADSQITDEGLDKFVRLRNLKTLILVQTPTTKDAIEDLRQKMPWCQIDWRKNFWEAP